MSPSNGGWRPGAACPIKPRATKQRKPRAETGRMAVETNRARAASSVSRPCLASSGWGGGRASRAAAFSSACTSWRARVGDVGCGSHLLERAAVPSKRRGSSLPCGGIRAGVLLFRRFGRACRRGILVLTEEQRRVIRRVLVLGATSRVARMVLPKLRKELPEADFSVPTRDEVLLPDDISKLSLVPGERPDLVVCLAAIVKPQEANDNPRKTLDVNVRTVGRLIQHYAQTPGCRLIFTSTVRTSSTDSMYAWSKIAAEVLVTSAAPPRVLPHVCVMRFGNLVESADVITGILESVTGRRRARADPKLPDGYVVDTGEYFQSADTLIAELALALSDRVRSGSVITPILPRLAVPFVAGLLAGYALATDTLVSDWAPEYRFELDPPSPIPDWWLPYTQLEFVDVQAPWGAEVKVPFLITNFDNQPTHDKDVREQETKELKNGIDRASRPNLGGFIQHVGVAGRFNQLRGSAGAC
jgi:RmlD substrate binding domain